MEMLLGGLLVFGVCLWILAGYIAFVKGQEKIMETFFGLVLITATMWFAYMSSHIVEEEKRGYYIPLPWEKKNEKAEESSRQKLK